MLSPRQSFKYLQVLLNENGIGHSPSQFPLKFRVQNPTLTNSKYSYELSCQYNIIKTPCCLSVLWFMLSQPWICDCSSVCYATRCPTNRWTKFAQLSRFVGQLSQPTLSCMQTEINGHVFLAVSLL